MKIAEEPGSRVAVDDHNLLLEGTRNYTVDAFRLLGALAVVVLHSISVNDFPSSVYVVLKNITRWAVPFFFLVSGYYFEVAYRKQPEKALAKRLNYLIGIFICANLVFLAFRLFRGVSLSSLLTIEVFVTGAFYHIWFLSSMIMGYLSMWFVLEQKLQKNTLLAITGAILLLVLITGSYAELLGLDGVGLEFSRHLISVPLLLTGYLCAKYRAIDYLSWSCALIFIVFGFSLHLAEVVFLYKVTASNTALHDMLVGTVLFALGLFVLSMKVLTPKENLVTRAGRDYSLLIYVYHPIIIDLDLWGYFDGNHVLSWVKPIGVFAICIALISFLHRVLPSTYRFISGNLWR